MMIYIEGAEPGDVLAITLVQVRLDRDFATTLNTLIPKVLPASIGKKAWRSAKVVKWRLDIDHQQGSPGDVLLPGALLYLGDGHAAQGDGELNGDALETSMHFGFTVRVFRHDSFPLEAPMVEDADHLMFFGIERSLDKSLKAATSSLLSWVQAHCHMTLAEASQVIGPSIQYRIPKVAATRVEVVAMIPRKLLEMER